MHRTTRDPLLLVEATILLVTTTILLRITSFSTTHSLLHHIPPTPTPPPPQPDLHADIACAIATASTHLPGSYRCLPKALAAHAVLTRHSQPAALHLGATTASSGISAHAWVTSGPDIVVGDHEDLQRYSRFHNPPT